MTAAWDFDAIGVPWRVETSTALPDTVRDEVAALIDAFDRAWSRFRPDSLVSALARTGGEVPAPPDAAAMLGLYASLADATRDAVSVLVGDALARRGYDASLSLVDRGAAPAPDWRALLTWDADRVTLSAPALLDVGALGKGRLVDVVTAAVTARVDGPVVVDASGDLRVARGTQRIGLEHPYDPARVIGVWEVTDAALCASAVNRRAWGGLHHVLDARTGEPVRVVAATWAVAADAMHADAAATALFFDGGPRWAHAHGVEWVRMRTDGAVEWSPGCRARLAAGGLA